MSRQRTTAWVLMAVVALLLVHFFLRARNPLHLPFFIDEHRHIFRAETAFDGHPARQSMGKFLLYIWLMPFQDNRIHALLVSRWAVALFSLIGSAALFALGRKLFNVQAGLIAVAFYALVPLALFYERMVLADGFAGVFGVLVAWQSVYLAQNPTWRRAIVTGALVGLAIMAKLTLTFSALLPVLAVLLLGTHTGQAGQTWREWLWGRTRRYMPYLVASGLTCIVLWLPVFIPAAIAGIRGEYYVLVDQSLADTSPFNEGDTERFSYLWEQISLMISEPMLIFLLMGTGLAFWKASPKAAYLVGWLVLMWIPGIVLVWRVRTRYLTPGVFAMGLLLAAGILVIQQLIRRQPIAAPWKTGLLYSVPLLIMGIWAAGFALPFAHQSAHDAVALEVPVWDENDYYRGVQSAYGLEETLEFINRHGTVDASGAVAVKGIFEMCARFNRYYNYERLTLNCDDQRYPEPDEPEKMIALNETMAIYAERHQSFYMIVEDYQNVPLDSETLVFIQLKDYQRPHNGVHVTLWRVCSHDDTPCQEEAELLARFTGTGVKGALEEYPEPNAALFK